MSKLKKIPVVSQKVPDTNKPVRHVLRSLQRLRADCGQELQADNRHLRSFREYKREAGDAPAYGATDSPVLDTQSQVPRARLHDR